jgi:hypothetical protein
MAQPKRQERSLTLVVSVPALANYYLEALGKEFRAALTRDQLASTPEALSGLASIYRTPPGGRGPLVPLRSNAWRVYLGGALVNMVPNARLGVSTPAPPTGQTRAVLVFDDQVSARSAAELDGTLQRRHAWLMQSEGTWFLRMRWRGPDFTHSPTEGYRPRVNPKRKRRWAVTPPDWPRRGDGRAMSNQAAAKVLGLRRMQELLKYTGAGE